MGFKGDNFFIENIGKNCSKNDKKSFSAKTAVSPFWRSTVEIYLQFFLLISPVVSEICHRQSSKCKMEQGALTPKLGKAVMVLMHCTSTY